MIVKIVQHIIEFLKKFLHTLLYQIFRHNISKVPHHGRSATNCNDDLPLAGQEDGYLVKISNRFVVENASDTLNGRTISSNTQSDLAALADSLNVEFPNDRRLSNQSEIGLLRFMEQNLTYRYFDDINRNYFHTENSLTIAILMAFKAK